MTLTKQQKVLLGVLGVGLAVVTVDRLVLAEGVAPAAEIASRAAAPSPSPVVPDVSKPPPKLPDLPTPNEDSIAHRLARYAESAGLEADDVREAFVPSAAWVPAPVKPEVARPQLEDPRTVFRTRHRLSAVLGSGAAALAIVDGTPLRIGQTFDGFTLVEVTQRTAVFTAPAGRVELTLSR